VKPNPKGDGDTAAASSLRQVSIYVSPEDLERLRRLAFALRASSRSHAVRVLIERAVKEMGV
jgi:hypothetical protein